MSRFDYVKYDEQARMVQEKLKGAFQNIEAILVLHLPRDRYQALALTAIEEAYAWCGKAVRDDQIARTGGAQLQEGRSDE